MPRLNVDDIWFDDPRRMKLGLKLNSFALADGVAINMWRLAQNYFRSGLLIPHDIFDDAEFSKEFLDVNLAVRCRLGVHVKGLHNAFEWIRKRQVSGCKGGKSKRKKQMTPGASKRNPPPHTLNKRLHLESLHLENDFFISETKMEKLKNIYPTDAGASGAKDQIKKQIRSQQDLERLTKAIQNYAATCKNKRPQYIKHFSTFMKDPRAGQHVFPWTDYVDTDSDIKNLSRADQDFINENSTTEDTLK